MLDITVPRTAATRSWLHLKCKISDSPESISYVWTEQPRIGVWLSRCMADIQNEIQHVLLQSSSTFTVKKKNQTTKPELTCLSATKLVERTVSHVFFMLDWKLTVNYEKLYKIWSTLCLARSLKSLSRLDHLDSVGSCLVCAAVYRRVFALCLSLILWQREGMVKSQWLATALKLKLKLKLILEPQTIS